MRKSYPKQTRLDCHAVGQVELNLECRDELVPILLALQHIHGKPQVRDQIMRLVAKDVNPDSSPQRGREGLGYWHIVVLAAVRLGCNVDYDRLQDLAENHRRLRHIMGIGDWDDQMSFTWKRLRDNICLLQPWTISRISQLIVAEGQRQNPEAAHTVRVDSFVMETNIHYPTESSLIWDGLRKVIELTAAVADDLDLPGWRQHAHLLQTIKHLHREIARVSASKKPHAAKKLKKLYAKLLRRTTEILERADTLADQVTTTSLSNEGRLAQIRQFAQRTRQVANTAYRRVILGEKVPNREKLFSIFEPHTQLYRRGKAGEENQFGRQVLICEDAAGFIVHHHFMGREEQDVDVAVPHTKILQERLHGAVRKISFDRGFYSPENERQLQEVVAHPCLPHRGTKAFAEQTRNASVAFRAARRRHPGVESAIGALQAGNGLKRSRDRTELGCDRYLCLAILGRNLHVLGKLIIAQQSPNSLAGLSKRKHVA